MVYQDLTKQSITISNTRTREIHLLPGVGLADHGDDSGASHGFKLAPWRRVSPLRPSLADIRLQAGGGASLPFSPVGLERRKRTPRDGGLSGFSGSAGGGLLSRDLSIGVPSALQGLTTVFGMGTGVAPALQPPAIRFSSSYKTGK